MRPFRYDQSLWQTALDATRAALGDDSFDAAYAEGEALPPDEVVSWLQRRRGERKRPSTGWRSLTPTEQSVVKLVAEGLSNPDIASRLFMSTNTVRTHIGHVFAKLGMRTRSELAAAAAKRSLGAGDDARPDG